MIDKLKVSESVEENSSISLAKIFCNQHKCIFVTDNQTFVGGQLFFIYLFPYLAY